MNRDEKIMLVSEMACRLCSDATAAAISAKLNLKYGAGDKLREAAVETAFEIMNQAESLVVDNREKCPFCGSFDISTIETTSSDTSRNRCLKCNKDFT